MNKKPPTIEKQLCMTGEWYSGVWSWAVKEIRGDYTERSGKWMLWPVGDECVSVWKTVCELTKAGKLGIQAKIARGESQTTHERLICVYTSDSDDKDDLQRVVSVLRTELDPKFPLIYKEDRATEAGMYSANSHGKPVSKWYVRPHTTVIRCVSGYVPPVVLEGLLLEIVKAVEAIFGDFNGDFEEYAWLEKHYGITEQEDVYYQLLLEWEFYDGNDRENFLQELIAGDKDAEDLLTNKTKAYAFLSDLLKKYQSNAVVYPDRHEA